MRSFVLFLMVCVAGNGLARAQSFTSAGSGLNVFATGSVSVSATRVRMQGTLKSTNADARRALERLRQMRAEAKEKLLGLKAEESSIEFSQTTINSSGLNDEEQMMMMMSMGIAEQESAETTQPPVVAASVLVADWVLPESDNDAMILFIKRLEEKVAQLDVFGTNAKPEVTSEQSEILEQMQRMQLRYQASGRQSTGAANFQFVAKVSADQKQQAVKLAYQSAVSDAKAMADAMGVGRGPLTTVSQTPSFSVDSYYGRNQTQGVKVGSDEVADDNPSTLEYKTTIQVTFAIDSESSE